MTSRGFASLQVAAGLPEVLACPEVAAHAREVEPHAEPVHALGDLHDVEAFIQTARDQGWTRGVLDLEDVNWFDDAALIAAAPQAAWQVYLGVETEQPGLWLAYTPGTGLVEASHVDHDVMVPVGWADPGTRTGAEERHLARITTVRAALEGMPQGRGQAGAPGAEVGELRRVPDAADQEPGQRPGGPIVRVTQPVTPTSPAVPTRPVTPGRSVR